MKNLVIVGTGDYALVAFHFLKQTGSYNIISFSEEMNYIRFDIVEGLPNISFEELEFKAPPEDTMLLIAIGPNKVNSVRERLYYQSAGNCLGRKCNRRKFFYISQLRSRTFC